MAPPKFLTVFDLPDLKLPSGKRNVTTVPTQSLVMLNDPLVSTPAKHWAAQPAELQNWAAALRDFATNADVMLDEPAWTQLALTFFNTAEFIHYR